MGIVRNIQRKSKNYLYPYKKTIKYCDIKMKILVANDNGDRWYAKKSRGVWPEMEFIKEHFIKEGDCVLEVGAHHGVTSLFFSKVVGDRGKVIAMEPDDANFDILSQITKINNATNIQRVNAGAGSKKRKLNIDGWDSNSHIMEDGSGQPCEIIPLDVFFSEQPNFLKIDVQGFEMEVLKGAKNILASRPNIAIELHPREIRNRYGATVDEIKKYIDLCSHEIWFQGDDMSMPQRINNVDSVLAQDLKNYHLFLKPMNVTD